MNPSPEHKLPHQQSALEEKGEILLATGKQHADKLKQEGYELHANTFEKVCELATAFQIAGGRALLVGGSVRDLFFGKVSKDYDLEVYHLEIDKIKEIVSKHGKVNEVGKAFGVLNLACKGGLTIDISLPRVDSVNPDPDTSDKEHANIFANADPYMSIKDAAKRRDFTINSLASDPLTGEVFDHYEGLKDIRERKLRITDEQRFADDALRVMRGFQFTARFGLTMDDRTKEIMTSLIPRIERLSKERITEEWVKLLTKSDKPSLGLTAAKELGFFKQLYPELEILEQTPQDPEWHPEGDVWIHNLMVIDQGAIVRKRENLEDDDAVVHMFAALCHDLGKPATTVHEADGHITSKGHEQAGEKPTREFLDKLSLPIVVKEKIVRLVMNHMMPGQMYRNIQKGQKISDSAIERLARRLVPSTIEELVRVCEADSKGRGLPEIDRTGEYKPGAWLVAKAEELGVYREQPEKLITGKDLIKEGFSPGKDFQEIIDIGIKLRTFQNMLRKLEQGTEATNYTKEEALYLVAGLGDTLEAIEALKGHTIQTINNIRKIRNSQRENKK